MEKQPNDVLQDFRMTCVPFGVSSSSFIAIMAVIQNAINFSHKYPLAAKAVDNVFYVYDCLTGADSVEEAIEPQHQFFAEATLFKASRILAVRLYIK